MRRLLWTLAAALSAFLASGLAMGQESAAPPTMPAERGTVAIHIRAADYGHAGALADCSVTEAVRQICEGKQRCVVDVNDRLCPPPGELPKGLIFTLSIRYSCQAVGPAHFAAADKPFQITIACQPNGS
jgi:hypothetical protein